MLGRVLLECSEGKYYLRNKLSDDVSAVLAPTKLGDAVTKLGDPDPKGMELEDRKAMEGDVIIAEPVVN